MGRYVCTFTYYIRHGANYKDIMFYVQPLVTHRMIYVVLLRPLKL